MKELWNVAGAFRFIKVDPIIPATVLLAARIGAVKAHAESFGAIVLRADATRMPREVTT